MTRPQHKARWTRLARLRSFIAHLPRRSRGWLLSFVVAAAIIVLALFGGMAAGKLEHLPTVHLSTPATTVPTALAPTTVAPAIPDPATVQAVKLALIGDMSLDLQSQRLDPSLTRRLALAETPAAVARRHADIALAWAPDKVAETERRYDALVRANAVDPASHSITDAAFVVTSWGPVDITLAVAHAGCRGHFRLLEPTNPAAPGGAIDQPERDWSITLALSGDRWRLEDRTATP